MSAHIHDDFPIDEPDTVSAPNPWPIRAISLLLVVQAIGIAIAVGQLQAKIDWERALNAESPSLRTVDTALGVGIFTPLALLLLIAALALFFQRRSAWLAAMTIEGLLLFFCLYLYFMTHSYLRNSPWIYLIMGYSALMVLYLNTADVRTAFLARPPAIDPQDLAAYRHAEGLDSSPNNSSPGTPANTPANTPPNRGRSDGRPAS